MLSQCYDRNTNFSQFIDVASCNNVTFFIRYLCSDSFRSLMLSTFCFAESIDSSCLRSSSHNFILTNQSFFVSLLLLHGIVECSLFIWAELNSFSIIFFLRYRCSCSLVVVVVVVLRFFNQLSNGQWVMVSVDLRNETKKFMACARAPKTLH